MPCLLIACSSVPSSPYENFVKGLEQAKLTEQIAVQKWLKAGEEALQTNHTIETPFREKGYFEANHPIALGFKLELQEGEQLIVNCPAYPKQTNLFLDLFYEDQSKTPPIFDRVMSAAKNTDSLRYEVLDGGTYILRVQPELLVNCRYDLRVLTKPLYGVFPVEGHGNKDIGSVWGDPRDGGKRKHEGIDVFAPKGTNLLAIADGYVSSVRNSGLGGKQVWIEDEHLQQSLYYAHLDEQLVREGQNVRAGDIIGTVGNTGNAKNTPPHLHFGIYVWEEAAVDPLPFVQRKSTQFPDIQVLVKKENQYLKTKNRQTPLYSKPHRKGKLTEKIPQYTAVKVIGAASDYYHVQLMNGTSAYVHQKDISSLDNSIKERRLKTPIEVFDAPNDSAAPFHRWKKGATISLLAKYGNYWLVNVNNRTWGWVK